MRDADRLGNPIVNPWVADAQGLSTGLYELASKLAPKLISVTRLGALALARKDVRLLRGTLASDHAHQFINPIR